MKRAFIEISFEALADVLLPEGYKVIDVFVDANSWRVDERINVAIEGDSLDDVPTGQMMPQVDLIWHKHNGQIVKRFIRK